MTKRRWTFLGMAAAVIVIVGAALLTHPRPERPDAELVTGPVDAPIQMATPEPTPPPWTGSLITAAVSRPSGSEVVLIELGTTTGPWLLTDAFDEVGHLAWSPDGQVLAVGARLSSNWDVYLLGRDGTGMTRLTDHPAYDGGPAWSPDGRSLAFASARDGNLEVYRLDLGPTDGGPDAGAARPASDVDPGPVGDSAEADSAERPPAPQAAPQRLTANDTPDIEPAWSPDGDHILFSAWAAGRYELLSVAAGGGDAATAASPPERVEPVDGPGPGRPVDLRRVTRLPGARGRLAYVESEHGVGPLLLADWDPESLDLSPGVAVAASASNYAWHPTGDFVAVLRPDRRETDLAVRAVNGSASVPIAELVNPSALAWTDGPLPPGLRAVEHPSVTLSPTEPDLERWASEIAGERPRAAAQRPNPDALVAGEIPGLVRINLNVPGNRINAALLDDYVAMRADVLAATGHDFLATLSDLWRPLSFDSTQSAFFSWHKTGRAFDTQMELGGPGGRSDMVLVRESVDGRTMWRMYLRAAAQDGSVGQPLTVPGWIFSAGGGDERFEATGGFRNPAVPPGYWVDFTRMAERYGWRRIPSLTQSRLDWRRDWAAIEYWHYERRDGLRWFEAMAELYPREELEAALHPDVLREQGISMRRLVWLGFPEEWRGG